MKFKMCPPGLPEATNNPKKGQTVLILVPVILLVSHESEIATG
jgi:hypothetical protein